ncbi:MAG: hypothetical protein WCU00_05730 [Candidatus Latescibacterota bacterium]
MKEELKKKFGDDYLTFISIAVGSVALIAAAVWIITTIVRKRKIASEDTQEKS